jgi:integration host factor subunit beta
MNKSAFIERMVYQLDYLPAKDVELAVKTVMAQLTQALSSGERIEIRGFGSFSLHHRPPRVGRNPKTGAAVQLTEKYVPHFKPGKALRERVNEGATT